MGSSNDDPGIGNIAPWNVRGVNSKDHELMNEIKERMDCAGCF